MLQLQLNQCWHSLQDTEGNVPPVRAQLALALSGTEEDEESVFSIKMINHKVIQNRAVEGENNLDYSLYTDFKGASLFICVVFTIIPTEKF